MCGECVRAHVRVKVGESVCLRVWEREGDWEMMGELEWVERCWKVRKETLVNIYVRVEMTWITQTAARERPSVCLCYWERGWECVRKQERERERESEKEKDDSVSISSRVEIFVDRGRAVFKLDPPKKARQKNPAKKHRSKKNILLLFKGKPPKKKFSSPFS